MNASNCPPVVARPAPVPVVSPWMWARRHLVCDWVDALQTLVLGGLLLWALLQTMQWAWTGALSGPDAATCPTDGAGACWSQVARQYRSILFGLYPQSEQWRAVTASLLLLGLLVACGNRKFWQARLLPLWVGVVSMAVALMMGGCCGLRPVAPELWGGLPLTLLLAWLSWLTAFPLALLLAFGLDSQRTVIRSLSAWYMALMRSVPLIAVLFAAFFVVPLCLPQGVRMDVLTRLLIGLILAGAVDLADILRSGLQSVPTGQHDAAAALGLGRWQTLHQIVLPQALARVLPDMVGHWGHVFQNTTLVGLVALHDLTDAVSLALPPDSSGHLYLVEGYVLVALFYWSVGLWISRCQRRWQTRRTLGAHHVLHPGQILPQQLHGTTKIRADKA